MSENKRQSAEIISPGLGDIEKVRDILFGKYVASFEQRFAELESRLEADVDQLKSRLSNRISIDVHGNAYQPFSKLRES